MREACLKCSFRADGHVLGRLMYPPSTQGHRCGLIVMKKLFARCAVAGGILLGFCIGPSSLESSPIPTTPTGPNRLLMMQKPGSTDTSVQSLHLRCSAKVLRRFPAFEDLQVVEIPKNADPKALQSQYQKSGLMSLVELDEWISPAGVTSDSAAQEPNDPWFTGNFLWYFKNTGQTGGTPGADIQAVRAWQGQNSASNIIVAIIDTGMRYTHEDLAGNLWTNPGEIPGNGIDDDKDGIVDDVHGINAAANTGDPSDPIGHGTQVAGVIGAVGNNHLGVVGVAWNVKLMPCRYIDDQGLGALSDLIQCFDYARSKGAKVINASFVGTNLSQSLQTAVRSCRNAGIIVVAGAGNDGKNTDVSPVYPAGFALDNIVAVGGSTQFDTLWDGSNFGAQSVDLVAPAVGILSTANTGDSEYLYNGGTSFSTAMVSGSVALLLARFPSDTYTKTISRLLSSVDVLPALAGKCATSGRLNLARALGLDLSMSVQWSPSAKQTTITIQGVAGSKYVLEEGSEVSAWKPISTNTAPANGKITLQVPQSLSQPQSFYRAYLVYP